MRLRGVKFHYAFDQSGVRNFDGSGWPYHKYFKPFGLTFHNCSFVAKTTTRDSRLGKAHGEPGYMALREDGLTPVEFRPDCIVSRFRQGVGLNAVGLSGPGLKVILEKGYWYQQKEPFMISLMAVGATLQERLTEIENMVKVILSHQPFPVPFGVQLNITCPNVGHEPQKAAEVIAETRAALRILRKLGNYVPLSVKINAHFDILMTARICDDDNCDALVNSNTIPWAEIPAEDRVRLFGSEVSPLAKYGGGGLSGRYLLPIVARWIALARKGGITKPIIAGGGILHPRDVDLLARAGASAIAVGSVAFLRPWRMQRIINRANQLGAAGGFFV